jgi:hypothetical protein
LTQISYTQQAYTTTDQIKKIPISCFDDFEFKHAPALAHTQKVAEEMNSFHDSSQFSSFNMDHIINIIISDDKLFQYVYKLVKSSIDHQGIKSSNVVSQTLVNIIDNSIDNAIEQVQIVDIINSLLKDQQYFSDSFRESDDKEEKKYFHENAENHSSRNGHSSTTAHTHLHHNQNPVSRVTMDKVEDSVDPSLPAVVKPPFSEREPEQITHQTVKKTVQQLNKSRRPPLASTKSVQQQHHYPSSSTAPSLSLEVDQVDDSALLRGDSETGGDSSFLSSDSVRESNASTVQMILPSLSSSLQFKGNNARSLLTQPDDSFDRHSGNGDRPSSFPLSTDLNGKEKSERLAVNQSFQVTSEINSVQNSFEIPSLPKQSASGVTEDEDKDDVSSAYGNLDETVKDWERKIRASMRKDSFASDDSSSNSFNNEEKKTVTVTVTEEEVNISHRYDNDSFEEFTNDQQDELPPKHGSSSAASTTTFPSVHNYLSTNYDPLKSNTTHSNIIFFDQDKYDDTVDQTLGNSIRKHVNFLDSIVEDVYYYERANSVEAKDMYYSHEELDRFDMHYRKEDSIAERMGLSWMEWKNQQPDEEEISFSDSDIDNDDNERDDDYLDDDDDNNDRGNGYDRGNRNVSYEEDDYNDDFL